MMHYYSWNIADYRKDAGHLSLLEHGIYRQMLDSYYLDEKPIETQVVIRRLAIKTQEERNAFENVVNDFFCKSDCGNFLIHNRADAEILKYTTKAEVARANGSRGGRPKKPKKTQVVISGLAKETQGKANHKPITNNHKPITNIKNKPKKYDFDYSCWPSQPTEQVLDDWLSMRKDKKAPVSQTVINAFGKELWRASERGLTVDECLSECLARGWQGLKCEWLHALESAKSPAIHEKSKTKDLTISEQLNDRSWATLK